MSKIEKQEKLEEIKVKIKTVNKYENGVIDVGFVRNFEGEERGGEFSVGPDGLRKIGFKGSLVPGMDIVLQLDEANEIKALKRILN